MRSLRAFDAAPASFDNYLNPDRSLERRYQFTDFSDAALIEWWDSLAACTRAPLAVEGFSALV